jgi:hypothetical protein
LCGAFVEEEAMRFVSELVFLVVVLVETDLVERYAHRFLDVFFV